MLVQFEVCLSQHQQVLTVHHRITNNALKTLVSLSFEELCSKLYLILCICQCGHYSSFNFVSSHNTFIYKDNAASQMELLKCQKCIPILQRLQ